MSRIKGKSYPHRKAWGLRARAWWVIRRERRFTLHDLLTSLCDGHEKCADGNLRKFLSRLVAVGVLRLERERAADDQATSNGLYVYRLARDLGPESPVVRVDGAVFDPNSGAILDAPGGALDLPGKRKEGSHD